MFIANELRKTNIAEYLLYMWQVEDTIRAFGLDIDRIRAEYAAGFRLSEADEREEVQWMDDLIRMMREEGCTEKGHLQINKGTVSLLTDLHQQLLRSPKHPFYSAAYYKALPFIVELRARGDKEADELETCLGCLYGVMMLRLQNKEITANTDHAIKEITTFIGMLSDYYKKDKEEGLKFE